jgi:hypothetical protein
MSDALREQISAFIDGTLDGAAEAELLHVLSVSPDKRAMLHEYMNLRSMIVADNATIAVPARLDASVLGALGLAGGAAAGVAAGASVAGGAAVGGAAAATSAGAAGATGAAGAVAWWSFARIAAVVLLTAGLTSAVWYSFGSGDTSGDPTSALAGLTPDPAAPAGTPNPVLAAPPGGSTPPALPPVAPRTIVQTVYVPVVDTVFVARDAEGSALASADRRDAAHDQPHLAYRSTWRDENSTGFLGTPRTDRRAAAGDTVYIPVTDTLYLTRIERVEVPLAPPAAHLPFEIELTREHAQLDPYPAGQDAQQQWFAGLVAWKLHQNHAVGVAAGYRPFVLKAELSNLLLDTLESHAWGSAFYRFTLPLAGIVSTHAQVAVGGMSYGPLLGARVGLRLSPLPSLHALVGVNGSVLLFNKDGRRFSSNAVGFFYGLSYSF